MLFDQINLGSSIILVKWFYLNEFRFCMLKSQQINYFAIKLNTKSRSSQQYCPWWWTQFMHIQNWLVRHDSMNFYKNSQQKIQKKLNWSTDTWTFSIDSSNWLLIKKNPHDQSKYVIKHKSNAQYWMMPIQKIGIYKYKKKHFLNFLKNN